MKAGNGSESVEKARCGIRKKKKKKHEAMGEFFALVCSRGRLFEQKKKKTKTTRQGNFEKPTGGLLSFWG